VARRYWKVAPGSDALYWDECREAKCIAINWLNGTDLRKFGTKEELKEELIDNGESDGGAWQIWYFVHDLQLGDVIVANEASGKAVGIGVVTSDYLPPSDRRNPFNRKKQDYNNHVRLVDWTIEKDAEFEPRFFQLPTVVELKPRQCERIKKEYFSKYPELQLQLDELFALNDQPGPKRPELKSLVELVEQFRQIILYGPPGTGKTREATRLALTLLSGKAPQETDSAKEIEKSLAKFRGDRFELVVFHPAYEYEQFVGGIEPAVNESGQVIFEAKMGIFLKLCRNAKNHGKPTVLVIDEINRGSLPKLLGELVYALEYRDHTVTLPFTVEGSSELVIPNNLYIIATMNSSDRSIGHMDVAIRRRFGLCHVEPKSDIVRSIWRKELEDPDYGNRLASLMDRLNAKLHEPAEVGPDVEAGVGQSYFLPTIDSPIDPRQQVENKWKHQVQPLLREYAQLLNLGHDFFQQFAPDLDEALKPS